MFLRKDINYINPAKFRFKNEFGKYKIFTFTTSIVNQLTMYINTNQLITTK